MVRRVIKTWDDNFWGRRRIFICSEEKKDNSIATADESRGSCKSERGGWKPGSKLPGRGNGIADKTGNICTYLEMRKSSVLFKLRRRVNNQ